MLEVDPKGLAKLMERKSPEWIVFELVQNAWDTKSNECVIKVEKVKGKPRANITVTDRDPEGFKDLSHAWTLFAESDKKIDPELRGRFNLGEKLVLAYTVAHGGTAMVTSTQGTVLFSKEGRSRKRQKTDAGSMILLNDVKLNQEQYDALIKGVYQLIPPVSVKTSFLKGTFTLGEGEVLSRPKEISSFVCVLPTEIGDEEGILRRTRRKTTVTVLEADGPGWLYEMGIPVVETGDKYHVDIGQKIPLNMDRDNVTPAYLRQVRVEVLNHTHNHLTEEDATQSWVRDASADERIEDQAVEKVMDLRFGKQRVAFDPSDPEGNKLAVSQGYTLVHGGTLSSGEWANVKRSQTILPAGQVTPSPKVLTSPDGISPVPMDKWTKGMKHIEAYTQKVGHALIGFAPQVEFFASIKLPWAACYGGGRIAFNKSRLGGTWFDDKSGQGQIRVNRLLLHEFGHHYSMDHLSSKYHDALCALGAQLAAVASDGSIQRWWESL